MSLVFSVPFVQADTEEAQEIKAIDVGLMTTEEESQAENPQEEVPEEDVEPQPEPEPTPVPVNPADKYVSSPTNTGKIPVLTYHMVVSNKQKKSKRYRKSSLAVSQSTFNQQMRYLASKKYRTINCEELYLWYTGQLKLPKRSVLITFDDGAAGVATYGLPVLKKYGFKATVFIVGKRTYYNKKGSIKMATMRSIQAKYPKMEFQSHTWGLHKKVKKNSAYALCLKDAAVQNAKFGFDYLAYPYGANSAGMRKAYAESGIKLAFTYGKNGYATRSQNIYKIRRIKVDANKSFKKFKKWVP